MIFDRGGNREKTKTSMSGKAVRSEISIPNGPDVFMDVF